MQFSIPVITYHTIGCHSVKRPWSFLTTPVDIFIRQMDWLYSKGYRTVTLRELYDYRTRKGNIPQKSVVLNFDDGFLDNWVIVADILKQYGFNGTVYVSTDFVDKRNVIRKKIKVEEIGGTELEDWWGYLSWNELREMEKSGCFDIQAHAKTHTWYYCSNQVVDFHRENDNYFWLWWNQFPEKKPFWLTEYKETDIPYGTPVLRYAKSLSAKQFFLNPEVISFCEEYVLEKGKHFLNSAEGRKHLKNEVEKKFGHSLGEYETDTMYVNRLEEEIILSKLEMEKQLGKKIEFLAFPGGGQNEISRKMIFDAGYLSVSGKNNRTNFPSEDASQFNRVGGWSGFLFKNQCISKFELEYFKLQIERGSGKSSVRVNLIDWAARLRRMYYNSFYRKSGENL